MVSMAGDAYSAQVDGDRAYLQSVIAKKDGVEADIHAFEGILSTVRQRADFVFWHVHSS
jgi:hypothetical protein